MMKAECPTRLEYMNECHIKHYFKVMFMRTYMKRNTMIIDMIYKSSDDMYFGVIEKQALQKMYYLL